MYARFADEHGLERFSPPPFSMLKYQKEIDRLERAYNTHFNTLWNMVSKAKFALMKRFFETIASRVKHVYDIANRDVEGWLRLVMAPLETQVREHHLQLRRRLDSISRIHGASGELEARVGELEQAGRVGRRGHRRRWTASSPTIDDRDLRRRARCRAPRTADAPCALSGRLRGGRLCSPSAPSYFRCSASFDSTWSGLTGMQSTGQTSTHCGVSKWPTHSVHFVGIDDVDLGALRDRLVRALRLADVAVDALVGDHQRHRRRSSAGSSALRPGSSSLACTRALSRALTSGWTNCETSPPKLRDLAHDRRRDEHVLLARRQEQRFDLGIEVAVHSGHLELVLEVGHRAQAAQDHPRALRVDEVHQQRRRTARPRRWGTADSTSRAIATRSAVVKNGCLDRAVGHADDHAVEEPAPRAARGPRGRG